MLVLKLPFQTLDITDFVRALNNLYYLFCCLVGLAGEEDILEAVADRHGEPVRIALVDGEHQAETEGEMIVCWWLSCLIKL